MMNKLAVILSLALLVPVKSVAAPVWASKPIQCGSIDEVLELMESLGEEPFIYFEGGSVRPEGNLPTKFVITLNHETNAWTLLEIPHPEQACVLGAGQGEINFRDGGTAT
jgi:hypothetical protein